MCLSCQFVDSKDINNVYKDIFIRDDGKVLSKIGTSSSTIFAKSGHMSSDEKNLILYNGNIQKLVKRAIKNKKGKKITVEIDNLNQLKKIMGFKFDRLLFDNMNTKNLRKGVRLSKNQYLCRKLRLLGKIQSISVTTKERSIQKSSY